MTKVLFWGSLKIKYDNEGIQREKIQPRTWSKNLQTYPKKCKVTL